MADGRPVDDPVRDPVHADGHQEVNPAGREPFQAAAVSIKAPVFDQHNPNSWFIVLEAQFELANIVNDRTRFFHALANLPPIIVSNISAGALRAADYDQLKAAVLQQYEDSRTEMFEKLLKDTRLVGKPSVFLSEMQKIAAKLGLNEDFIRHRFQTACPQSMTAILATQKNVGLDDLGKLADELTALCQPMSHVAAITSKDSSSSQRATDLGLVPFSKEQRPKVCRAHIFYGRRAKKCRSWCQWPDKGSCEVVVSRHGTPVHSRGSSPTRSGNGKDSL